MGIREEIAGKILSAKVKEFDDLVVEKNSIYIKENASTPVKVGYETSLDCFVISDTRENTLNLIKRLENEIGTRGLFGEYYIQLMKYSSESPLLNLDKLWSAKMTIKIIWEAA